MLMIDRYIIRQFLINFMILLFVLITLFVLIDMVANLDEFIDAARHMVQERQAVAQGVQWTDSMYDETKNLPLASLLWSTALLIWDWHGPLSVLLFVYLSGLVTVGALGFTFSEMIRKGEIVAMLASGVSMYRIAAPLMVVGALVSVASLPIQEWLIPPLAERLARSHQQLGQAGLHNFKVRFARDGQGHLFSAATFDSQHREMLEVSIIERDKHGAPRRFITASQALWNEQSQGWDLLGANEQLPLTDEDVSSSASVSSPDEVTFFATSLSPQVLMARRAQIYPSLLGIADLRSLRQGGAADTAVIDQVICRRFSMVVINMLMMFMGAGFMLKVEPVSMLVQAVRCVAVCLGGWVASLVILQLGHGQLSPMLVAWLPVIIFLPLSGWLFFRIRT